MHPDVERLTRIVPPPAERRPRDRPEVEARPGRTLPEDFKNLVDTYGGGVFDETIWILEPDCADPDHGLLAMKVERAEVLERLWEIGPEPRPRQLEDDGAGLLPLAYIEGTGAHLYWLTGEDVRPEDWTVPANAGRGPEWEHHPVPSTRLVLSVLTGEIRSDILDDLPADDHTFDPNDEILGG
ncbi:SMI1/KNR4 family protein [Streptomyces sp. NPDC058877]|uniref:SMI1/KNR4 family protein n=1 Tax=Streptomyces sp. NPDC058877 TaxID=3346665 RepID=UPI00367BE9C7